MPCRSIPVVFASLVAAFCALRPAAAATTYYVAPTSGGPSNGTIDFPFTSFAPAITAALPGDTILVRGGTYNLSSRLTINKSGAVGNPINLWSYPGETPILDFATNPATPGSSSARGVSLSDNSDWWHIKGLTIQNAGDNGLYSEGDHGVFEQLTTRRNGDSGLQLHGTASHNLVINSDSYENFDAHTFGENADGFAAKFDQLGPGNIIRGSRAWGNSDDGWDMWQGSNGVLVENSWSFDNGFNTWGISVFEGDGTGYKLGQTGGPHVLAGVLAWNNANNGIDVNGNGSHVEVYNSTSYDNGGANWRWDENLPHTLKNNISLGGGGDVIFGPIDDSFNTWNGIPASAADFLSLDDAIARGPRNPDGSLPMSDFLRLAADSNLIDAGTPISFIFNGTTYNLPYDGAAPDLGAYEATLTPPPVAGDYNEDGNVDAADYVVWRDTLGQTVSNGNGADGNHDGTIGGEDYDVWKNNFGAGVGSGDAIDSASTRAAVPEPATLTLVLISLVPLSRFRKRRTSFTPL